MESWLRYLALFRLFWEIDGFKWFLNAKSSQDYTLNAGVPQGATLGHTLFLLYITDLPDDVICNIAIYVDDTTLYSNRVATCPEIPRNPGKVLNFFLTWKNPWNRFRFPNFPGNFLQFLEISEFHCNCSAYVCRKL